MSDNQVNELNTEQKKSMKSRIITAIIMIAVALPCVIFGGWAYFLLVLFVLINAIAEAIHAANKRIPYAVVAIMFLVTIYFAYWIFAKNLIGSYLSYEDKSEFYSKIFNSVMLENLFSAGFTDIFISSTGTIVILVILFVSCFFSSKFTTKDVAYFFMMSILIGLGIQSIQYLRYSPTYVFQEAGVDTSKTLFKYWQSAGLLLYVVLGTLLNDAGAYFIGVLFGKHKVNPRISPKKTWEGLIGGCIISVVASFGFAMIMSVCGVPILPSLTHNEWYFLLAISIVISVLGVIGDFAFSAIKRETGIKDYSKIFKEHGGVLDRIDSVIFTSIGASVLIVLINHGWEVFNVIQ